MTLQQLRYVVTIAEIGTISKAAEELFVSQPSLTKALKELEKELEQYDKDMWRHLDCLQKYKHIGEEIPKDVPFTEYFGYIIRNFRNPKPRKEWTVRDYKVDAAKEARKMAAFTIKDHGYKEPLTDRQKRVVERIRNGTDFHVFNSMEEIRKRFK